LAAVVAIASLVRRRNSSEDRDDSRTERRQGKVRIAWLALAIIMAVAGLVAFLLTEDINTTVVWTDNWTPLMAILFVAGVISSIFTFGKKKDDNEEDQGYPNPAQA
jgi:cytochrome bd-type quinol oxidase subunit 2